MTTNDSNDFYRAFFEHSMDAVFLTAPGGSVFAANPAACAILGRSEDEICRLGREGLMESGPDLTKLIADRKTFGQARGELVAIHRDGRRIPVDVTSKVFTDSAGNTRTIIVWRDLTEQKKVSAEKERYLKLFRLSTEPMCIADPFGCFLHVNPAFVSLTGYTERELVSHPFVDFVHPEDRQRTIDEMKRQVALGPSIGFENRYICRDGHVVHLSWYAYFDEKDGITYATARDVTLSRKTLRELTESEEKYRSVVTAMAEGVVFQDADGKIIATNPAASIIEARPERDMLGRDSHDPTWGAIKEDGTPFPGDEHPAMVTLRTGAPQSNVIMGLKRIDGELRWISINSQPLTRTGEPKPYAVVTTFHDITENKKSAEEIAHYVAQFETMTFGTLQVVAKMVDRRDPYTAGHQRRVGLIAAEIGKEMGFSEDRCRQLQWAGMVHDNGKIGVPVEILSKPAKLTALEYELIQDHAEQGYEILKDLEFPFPIADIIRQHHERYDGSGYPHRLKGDQILPEARILAVADVIESIASHRPYRPALGVDFALNEIREHSGTRYDPEVVSATLSLLIERGYQLPA